MVFRSWRSGTLLSLAFERFNEMLERVERIFDIATDILLCKATDESDIEALKEEEKKTDALQTEIRRKTVEYLSLHPGGDVIAALLLFSVAKDAERLGDLAINILDARHLLTENVEHGEYAEALADLEAKLESMFKLTRRAFKEQDEKAAEKAVWIRAQAAAACNALLKRVMEDPNISVHRAVSYTLLERHFKRTAAHLYHIASAVLDPAMLIEHRKSPGGL